MHALSFLAVVHVLSDAACGAAPVGPSAAVALVLQISALGGAVGSLVAWRAKRRDADADTWGICTAWTLLGVVVGAMVLVARLLT